MVIASRDLPGARNEEDHKLLKPRKWGIRGLARFASLCWRREGWRIRDVLHGVKGFTVDAYRRMRISEIGVTVDLEMAVRAYRLRIPRAEIPVVETARTYRHSRFPIWRTGKKLAWFLARELVAKPPAVPASPAPAAGEALGFLKGAVAAVASRTIGKPAQPVARKTSPSEILSSQWQAQHGCRASSSEFWSRHVQALRRARTIQVRAGWILERCHRSVRR